MANSFVVRLKCPHGDRDGSLVLQDRKETLIQVLATPWDFNCPVHGVLRVLPVEVREKRPSTATIRRATEKHRFSPTVRIFLGLVTAVAVSAITLSGIMLFERHSRQARLSQFAKLGQAAQVVDGVATVKELAEPWSSKAFIFHSLETKENIPSIVVRLPDSVPDQQGSYWAFSLQTPFGHCQLEYITDLQKLSNDYRFEAKHPMVGDLCSHAVFDPLQMADLPGGAWARGAIVKGYGFRPPIGIEIRIQSDQLVPPKLNRESRSYWREIRPAGVCKNLQRVSTLDGLAWQGYVTKHGTNSATCACSVPPVSEPVALEVSCRFRLSGQEAVEILRAAAHLPLNCPTDLCRCLPFGGVR